MSEAGSKTLQKSYSFDNVSFSITTADPKDVGAIQKSMQTLSKEMTADLAKFTADELAATIKKCGPDALVQAGAIEALKNMAAENSTKANAYIVITSLATTVGSTVEVRSYQMKSNKSLKQEITACSEEFWALRTTEFALLFTINSPIISCERNLPHLTEHVWLQPLLVPFIPSLVEGVSHKKKEVQVAADQAGHALIDILCPWAIRVVQSMLFAGALETKWQVSCLPFSGCPSTYCMPCVHPIARN
jgi:hypothetical protein